MLSIFLFIIVILISMQLESSFGRFYFNRLNENKHFDLLKTIIFLILISFTFYLVPTFLIFRSIFLHYTNYFSINIFPFIILSALLICITNVINLHFRYSSELKNFLITSLSFPIFYLTLIYIGTLVYDSFSIFYIFLSQFISLIIVLLMQYNFIGKQLFQSKFQLPMNYSYNSIITIKNNNTNNRIDYQSKIG